MGASASSPSPPQAAADDLQAALSATVDGAVMTHVLPLQRDALRCTLACCDAARSPADLAACSSRCDAPVQAAQAVLQANVQDFQARLQRAAQACADAARGSLPPSPSDKLAAAAQARMNDCVASAAAGARRELPVLARRVEEGVREVKAAVAAQKGGT
jgi:hypothetical protein